MQLEHSTDCPMLTRIKAFKTGGARKILFLPIFTLGVRLKGSRERYFSHSLVKVKNRFVAWWFGCKRRFHDGIEHITSEHVFHPPDCKKLLVEKRKLRVTNIHSVFRPCHLKKILRLLEIRNLRRKAV